MRRPKLPDPRPVVRELLSKLPLEPRDLRNPRLLVSNIHTLVGWVLDMVRDLLSDPVRRFRALLYAGAGAIIFLFVISISIPSLANPAFCASCHNHPWVFTTRLQSPHAKVTCKACHTPPGIVAYFIDEVMAGGKSGLLTITGRYEQPINYESIASLHIPDRNCNRCHAMENRPVTPTRGLIIDHKVHAEKGINCTSCHNRAAHLEGVRQDKGHTNFNSEYGCLRCHRDTEKAGEGKAGGGEGEGAGGAEHGGEGGIVTPHEADNQHEVNGPTASQECSVCHRGGVL